MKGRVAHILGKYSTTWTTLRAHDCSLNSRLYSGDIQLQILGWGTEICLLVENHCLNSHSQFEDRALVHLSWCCPCYKLFFSLLKGQNIATPPDTEAVWKDRAYYELEGGNGSLHFGVRLKPLASWESIIPLHLVKGCTQRDNSFTQTYFQIRILK